MKIETSPQQCRGCGAPIHWVKMPSGKNMPVDAEPKKMIVIIPVERPDFTGSIPLLADAYMPHWATCPKADDFKKNAS